MPEAGSQTDFGSGSRIGLVLRQWHMSAPMSAFVSEANIGTAIRVSTKLE